MSQYQSFPNTQGSSKSLDKLKALRLPPLAGHSFLDVGCNEGFFCGFAQYQGASRVLGLDRNKASIERARSRFPNIEFKCQSWDETIEEKFDVILLASAMHYAKDQEALVHKLMGLLTPTGTLVLEIGMAQEPGNKWVTVKRSIDERQFPTRGRIAAMLDAHAWKIIGHSVDQAGDPLSRVVVHIQKKRPYAFLLMSPSGYGKTTITRLLATAKNLTHVSGDNLMRRISEGKVACTDELRELIARDYASTNIARITQNIFQSGLGEQWIDVWLDLAKNHNVIVDSYVPQTHWPVVTKRVEERGFVPIQLNWNLVGPKLLDRGSFGRLAEGYLNYLAGTSADLDARPKKRISLKRLLTRKVDTGLNAIDLKSLPEDFDPQVYLQINHDVALAGMNPSIHYLKHGIREGRRYKLN